MPPTPKGLLLRDPEPGRARARPKRAAKNRRDEPMPLDPVVREVLESLRLTGEWLVIFLDDAE